YKVKQIINKYSDHISLPIQMQKEVWQDDEVAEGEEQAANGKMVKTEEWETINSASALWTRNKNEISEEQYIEVYKNLSHDFDVPLAWAHNRVEGSTEYT
ncbi:molecular chaperone HtpG, partial [Acinetobacter ursingii]